MEQIGSRAERMGLMDNSSIYLYSATRLEVGLTAIRTRLMTLKYHCISILCQPLCKQAKCIANWVYGTFLRS